MLKFLDELRVLTPMSGVLRLCLATAFGGLIGLERGRKGRAAGFRTYMIVCIGAALTMMLGQYESLMVNGFWAEVLRPVGVKVDVSRFGAQVINGIGFLGAGTVLITDNQKVKGLTTAAGLWASACMGIAIGAGFYECVMLAFTLIFLCNRVLPFIENAIVENARNINLYVEFNSLDDVSKILGCMKAMDAQIYEVDIERGGHERLHPSLTVSLRLNRRKTHAKLILALSELESIHTIDEL